MYIINPDFFFLPLLRGKKMPIDALQKYFLPYIRLAQRGVISEEATPGPSPPPIWQKYVLALVLSSTKTFHQVLQAPIEISA